jgi:hypothetical protein
MWYALYLIPVSLLGLLALVQRFPPPCRAWAVAPRGVEPHYPSPVP